MAEEKVIAKLIGKLVFQADNRPLMAFEKRLDAVNNKMRSVVTLANKRITLKIGIDMRSFTQKLKIAEKAKIRLTNVGVDSSALGLLEQKISQVLSGTKISIKNIKLPLADMKAQKNLMRSFLESTTIDLPVDVKLRQAEKTIRAWKRNTEQKFKLMLEADISRAKFLRNVKQSLQYVTGKVGTIRLGEPKIKLTVDKPALRIEIQQVLKQIEREAKIRIDLRGSVGGSGGAGGYQGQRRYSRTDHYAGAGLAGATMGAGRGFIPGLGAGFAAMQLNRINQELQAQELAMRAVMGGVVGPEGDAVGAGKEQQQWFRNVADNLGLDVRQTQPAYTKMLASGTTTGFDVKEVQNIFTGISAYGRTMGLDGEAMKGTMRAVEQMMNKGQIMSEELKGQLAERAPGVISAMAEAAGFTGEGAAQKLFKAMENGDVMAKDVLGKFSEILLERSQQGGALAQAMESTAAQQARFNNAFLDSVKAFSEGGFDAGVAGFFKNMSDAMERAEPLTRALGGAFEILMRPIDALVVLVGDLGEAFPALSDALGIAEKNMAALGIAAIVNLTPLGRIFTAISVGILALEDFITYLKGGESQFGKFMASLSDENRAKLEGLGASFMGLASDAAALGEAVGGLLTKLATAFGSESEGAFGGFLSLVDNIIGRLRTMIQLLTKLAELDLKGAAAIAGKVVQDNMNAAGSLVMNAVDSVLPGNPMQSLNNRMGELSKPTNSPEQTVKERTDTEARYTPRVPLTQPQVTLGPISMPISGVTDPQAVGVEVERKLNSLIRQSMVGLGEAE